MEDSSHVGGANIEAEEKAMLYLFYQYEVYQIKNDIPLLGAWCENFYNNHKDSNEDVELTQEEKDGWIAAVEAFKEHHASQKGEGASKDLYDSPVDTILFPTTLLDLWNKRHDCIEKGVVITGNRPSQIIKVRWR